LVLMKVAGALVMNVGPVTVATGGPAGAAVTAPADATGAAVAIAPRATTHPKRRVRIGFMSNLPFDVCVNHVSSCIVPPVT
jgi:hypothetical protein